ncbi:MAG: ribosome small subunit-dependent GTPase A [Ignavibacteriaceae bacterium]
MQGTIIRIEKDYFVSDNAGTDVYRCTLRGKFKKDFHMKKEKQYALDIVVVGDSVEFSVNKDNSGVIEKILPRKNYISRKAPKIKGSSYGGSRLEQVIAANIDALVIVSSLIEPVFNYRVIDRFLVAVESSHIEPVIVINKMDLDTDNLGDDFINAYRDIGYTVIPASTVDNRGIDELKLMLKNKKTIFWGQSGVGKSSVINTLYPGLDLVIGEISSFNQKGKHTTVTSTMIPAEEGTFIIDTPGIREIDPFGIRKQDLGHYFIDFLPYINACKFSTCTHNHEPDCAVEQAVRDGEIHDFRYESYLRLLETIEEDMNFR